VGARRAADAHLRHAVEVLEAVLQVLNLPQAAVFIQVAGGAGRRQESDEVGGNVRVAAAVLVHLGVLEQQRGEVPRAACVDE